jgi:hypothetical protein
MRLSFLRCATLALVTILGAGCGNDDNTTTPDQPAPQTPATPAPAPTTAPAPAPSPEPAGGLVSFFGAIDAVEPGSLTVGGRVFGVDGETHVLMRGSEVPFSSLQVGQFVVVRARQNREGAWMAREIKIRVEGPSEIKTTGKVESIAAPDIMVAGRLFLTGPSTVYLGIGDPQSLRDVLIGSLVTVTSVEEDGIQHALKIRVEAKP